jgi:hypothetical protein
MWPMIPSVQSLVEVLAPAFTQPTLFTCCGLLLGLLMCPGKPTLLRVAQCARPRAVPDLSGRHDLDCYYNFFERSSWRPLDLARRLAVLLLTRLNITGTITLLVDDTLLHKHGKSVFGLGWFRDAVASTKKRVATAPGHNWVVLAVAWCLPSTTMPVLAFPLLARLHQVGQQSQGQLAAQMIRAVVAWYPGRRFVLCGDGGYSCCELLLDLPYQVHYVGRVRCDAALYDPKVPPQPAGKPGRKPQKGPRLANPKQAALLASRRAKGYAWESVRVRVYGRDRDLLATSYRAVWPEVLGLRSILVVVVRDPLGHLEDTYLFTTKLQASLSWVISKFAWRWSIEVLFRSSKQVLQIEAPQHWCSSSVEKVAPWMWAMHSVLMVWYVTAGRPTQEACEVRQRMSAWDSEWSLRNMLGVFRRVQLNCTFDTRSASRADLVQMVQTLKNWVNMAA